MRCVAMVLLLVLMPLAGADQITLTTEIDSYYDWQGNEREWTESNLLDYPAYEISDNGNNYTIRRFNSTSGSYDTVNLPIRNYLTYNFRFDTISVSGKIMNQTQAVSVTEPYNATVRYLPLPFSASQINSVTDDLIEMGVFNRYLNFYVQDSSGTQYNFEKHVVGNEIRLYFFTADFASATYPFFINESTIVTLVANTSGNNGQSGLLTGENAYATSVTNAQWTTRSAISAANMNSMSVDDTTYFAQAGSTSKDAIININFTLSNVQSVNWVLLSYTGTSTTTQEHNIIGLYNASTPGWTKLNSQNPVVGTYATVTYNVTSAADKSKYLVINGNNLTFRFAVWNNGTANAGHSADLFKATVDYNTPLTDTSFTVSLPGGETQAFFNATGKSSSNVAARSQTSGVGFLYFTNTGNVAEKFFMNVTSTAPSGVTLKADTDNNPTGATTITTTLTQIIASLAVSGTQYVWLWADYSNALPMNQQRTLTTNSSII